MKKSVAILIIFSFVISIFATVPQFDPNKFYSKTLVVCFDKQVLSDREGILNYTIENGVVKTGIGDFDNLARKYQFVGLDQQVKHLKDLDWNDHGIYPRNIYKVFLKSDENIEKALQELKNTPHILFAEYDPIMKLKYIPNDPLYSMEWHLPQIDAPELWDYVTGNEDIVIGIIDAGIYFTHPDLKDNIWINEAELPGFDINQILETGNIVGGDGIDNDGNGYVDDVIGWNFYSNNRDSYQDYPSNDHGTHVAGCAAAVGDNEIGVTGVAMHLKLISSRHAPTNQDFPYVSNAIPGMYYCIDNGADIINCSFGGPGGGSSYNTVVNYGVDHGTLTVTAAGNESQEHNSSYHDYPADCDNALCVAATAQNDYAAYFTDYGAPIDVAAPGVDIKSTIIQNDGYASYQGTSMASPIVAGVAAMVLAVHPNLSPLQLRQRIMETTDYIDDINPDLAGLLGTGRVNVFTAAMYDLLPKLTIENYHLTEAEGNGDDVPNPGETLNFTMMLQNQFFTSGFWAPATNVIAHFSTDNPGVTLSNTDISFGDIGQAGASWNNDSPLIISPEENLQDLTIPLHIVIEANQNSEYPYHQEYDISLQLSIMQGGWPISLNGASESAPTIIDLNNDGVDDLVFGTNDGFVYAVTGNTEPLEGFPVQGLGGSIKTIAADDINNDGYPEIVAVTSTGKLTVINKDGAQIWQAELEQPVKTNPIIAEINQDKKIIVVGQTNKIFVFNSDGSYFDNYPLDIDSGTLINPAVGDLDNDGNLDLIYFTINRNLHAINISTAQELNGWPQSLAYSTISGGILFTTINNAPAIMLPLSTKIYAYDGSGNQIFLKDITPDQARGEIVSGDINGDGIKDYVFNEVGGKVYAIDSAGNNLENFPVELNFNIESTPILVDMDNDGASEILFGDNEGYFNAIEHTGNQYPNFPINIISAVKNSAAIGDLDGDGDPEIAFSDQAQFYALDIGPVAPIIDWPTARLNNLRWGNDTLQPANSNNNNISTPSTSLGKAYPNPFVSSQQKANITISYNLKEAQNINIEIYNIKGQKVATIENGYKTSGKHLAKWNVTDKNGKKVGSGIYFYRLNTSDKTLIGKFVILK